MFFLDGITEAVELLLVFQSFNAASNGSNQVNQFWIFEMDFQFTFSLSTNHL